MAGSNDAESAPRCCLCDGCSGVLFADRGSSTIPMSRANAADIDLERHVRRRVGCGDDGRNDGRTSHGVRQVGGTLRER